MLGLIAPKPTSTFDSPWPQPLAKVACTVAVDSTWWLWVNGERVSTDPGHGPVPILVHWIDSLPTQLPASTPPVFSTCPLSKCWVVVPSIVTSTSGMMPSGALQLPTLPLPASPMSELSKVDGTGPVQPSAAPLPSWVTIRSWPGASWALGVQV